MKRCALHALHVPHCRRSWKRPALDGPSLCFPSQAVGPAPPCPLVCASPGSMLVEGTLYTQYLLEVLKEGLPTADIVYPRCDQAEAAAWLACWLLNPQQHIARR